MAARGRVSLKLPEKQLRRLLKLYGDDVLTEINESFREASADALGFMVELAPFKTGQLESSAQKTDRVTPRGRRARTEFKFDTPYAAVVHELPEDARGPGTVAKPGNEFGPAGPKYIERVLRNFKLGPRVADALRAFWRRQREI